MDLVIPFKFEEVWLFHNGKAELTIGNKLTQIDV